VTIEAGHTLKQEDVTPDGERFLLNLPTESRSSANFHAIFNWTALLEDRNDG
jgi:hypothetical protein